MKKFCEFVNESKQMDKKTFDYHARGYIHHANRAAELEDDGPKSNEQSIDFHWGRSQNHLASIRNALGNEAATALANHLTSDQDSDVISDVWKKHGGKRRG